MQFLDQTVALTKFGLGKSTTGNARDGWLAWQRVYEFDLVPMAQLGIKVRWHCKVIM